jgi:DNA polymerase V
VGTKKTIMRKIGIIDCNNFYVSCERVFNPISINRPTVVLSNNDGCIIARSQEAKDLKMKMGDPYFKKKEFMDKHNFCVYSSNYNLYGDMSDRVMETIKGMVDKVEVYSVDECFIDVSDIDLKDLNQLLINIRNEIKRITGIPVSIGVGPNKTLAKLTSKIAKKQNDYNGVCSYWDIIDFNSKCDDIPLDDLWGIGRQWYKKLGMFNINKISEFMRMDDKVVRKLMNVNGLRTKMELNGHLCFDLINTPKKRKSITSSRSFGSDVDSLNQLSEALYNYVVSAVKKLKDNNLHANNCTIFVMGNKHKNMGHFSSKYITLQKQTQNIEEIWAQVYPHLRYLYSPDKIYKKCGIIFNQLLPDNIQQHILFENELESISVPVNEVRKWEMKQAHLSKRYTTNINDLPIIG